MEVVNEVMPTSQERIEAMMEPGPDEPIYMVNLLKFKEHAEYEDGRATDLTGYQAYQLYGAGVSKLLPEYGGELGFRIHFRQQASIDRNLAAGKRPGVRDRVVEDHEFVGQ